MLPLDSGTYAVEEDELHDSNSRLIPNSRKRAILFDMFFLSLIILI